MNWRNLCYICCITSSFNCVLFQVLFIYLDCKSIVEVPPEAIPSARYACLTCGIIHLVILIISIAYLNGFIKCNPLSYTLRFFNISGRHGPATGSLRYRVFTDDSITEPDGLQDDDPRTTNIVNKKEYTLEMIDLN